jgi:hypothetical protein
MQYVIQMHQHNLDASPNGLFGDEACALARYAGMSDQLMSIGFYDFNPDFDKSNITAKQVITNDLVFYGRCEFA